MWKYGVKIIIDEKRVYIYMATQTHEYCTYFGKSDFDGNCVWRV